MKLYLDSGFLDFSIIEKLRSKGVYFIFIFGARGVGKTYGSLKFAIDNKKKFMFTRRTQSEMDLLNIDDFSPFKPLNDDFGWHIGLKKVTKYNAAIYNQIQQQTEWVPEGEPIGYTSALSTVGHIRGFAAEDIEYWFYDEFIPEGHFKALKNEGEAFLNAYETINRNRELKGAEPLTAICMANANKLANPIFIELELVELAEKMEKKNQNILIDEARHVALVNPFDSPVAEKKKDTVLYRLANKNSAFYKMAVGNTFADFDGTVQVSRNIIEYRPLLIVGELEIYKHKSNGTYYATFHKSGSPERFGTNSREIARAKKTFPHLVRLYVNGSIEFESYMCEALFNKYFYS